jgi:thiol-disulfide isomerase/thioredoxin
MPSSIVTQLYNDLVKPYRNQILFLFLGVVFATASYFAYIRFAKPVAKYSENFGSDISNDNDRRKGAKIIFFFADWCPHCTKAKPQWEKFVPKIDSAVYGKYVVQANNVDCTDGTNSMIQQYNIDGYPTVLIVKDDDSTPVKFSGSITTDALKSFVTTALGEPEAMKESESESESEY